MIEPIIIKIKSLALLPQKKDWPYLSTDEVMVIQLDKFKKLLLKFCGPTYYGRILDKLGITPPTIKSIKSINDLLPHLPILTKEMIFEQRDELLNLSATGIISDSSGGSTGTPLNFYHDRNWCVNIAATTIINDMMQGWRFFHRHAKLWGAPRDISEIKGPLAMLGNFIRNRRFYDSFDMSQEKMAQYHSDLQKFKPEVILSYASSIHLLAHYLETKSLVPDYPLHSIITTAECLHDSMRATIERVFKVPVYDRYGSREVGCIAGECPEHNGMHLHPYDHIVECVDASGKGIFDDLGELIITDLNNYAFPFIRYRIGDLGIISSQKCSCSRTTPLLKIIIGRTTDTITTKSGRLVHGEYFTHAFYGIDGVEQFQFVQEDLDSYVLYIVRNKHFKDDKIRIIRKYITDVIGLDVRFVVTYVDNIPLTPSGKHRFTISKVPIFNRHIGDK